MTTAASAALSGLASIVGASRVVTDAASCAALAVGGKVPACVVYAPGADEVAALLRYATEHDLAVIPCRNATKLTTSNLPRRYDVALSLKEMNRVWHYEPADLTVSVEPGMKFGDFQHFVGRDGLWLPLDPPGGGRASLGGIVATNACGPLRLSYGAPRDMVLGMRIATGEGRLIKAGGHVVKNVAGYDMGKLLIGSYGTLGVIVEVSLKLFPLPTGRTTFVIPAGTLGIARDLRRRILTSPLTPMRMVLLDAPAATLVRRGTPFEAELKEPEIWVEFGGSERVLARCARELDGIAVGGGAAARQLDTANAEHVWAHITDFGAWLTERYTDAMILKTVLADAASEEFLSRGQQEAESDHMGLASVTQMGVGVVRLGLFAEGTARVAPVLAARLRRAAEDLGGALVVEHSPSGMSGRIETWGAPGDDFDIMKKLKATWDPKGILAPGRFVGGL